LGRCWSGTTTRSSRAAASTATATATWRSSPTSARARSEFNQEAEPTRIYQIWIEPSRAGLAPRWAKRQFPKEDRSGALVALASGRDGGGDDVPEGPEGALPIHQDAAILGATLSAGQNVTHRLDSGRSAYLVVARGAVEIAGAAAPLRANERDGVTISDEPEITIAAVADSEVLLADLP
jgi:redox-sensitive bicupin YhaK (pirin superfamily)